jgi:predicted permease
MSVIGDWLRRLWYLLNRRRLDAALRDEMEAHRAMMASPARFGNTRRLREEAAEVWGWRWLDEIGGDVRLALRSLRRSPVFTVAAVLSLGLAVALLAATGAVVNAYLIRSLPYPEADRLYHVMYAPPGPWEPANLSALDWTALDDVVEHVITTTSETFYPAGGGSTEPSRGLLVSRGFIAGLGVRAAVGRHLTEEDFAGAEPVVMISARLWRDHFASATDVVGRRLVVELQSRNRAAASFRVVGVLPEGFWFGRDSRDLVDVIAPLRSPARAYRVRLREGVPVEDAKRRIAEAVRLVAGDVPPNWPGVTLESARERYVGAVRPVLSAAAGSAALVLLVACANLGVVTLLRANRRQKEVGVRLALGAGRARIARMLVVEAGLLVGLATTAGLLLAAAGLRLAGPLIATELGRPAPGGETALHVDTQVALAVAALGIVIAAALPLLALTGPWSARLASALRRDHRTSTDTRGARRWRATLIAAQVAGAVALLVGSALMVQSLLHMVRTDFGIRTDGLVRVGVDFPEWPNDSPQLRAVVYDQFVGRVAAVTGAAVPLFQWPQFFETPKQPVLTGTAGAAAVELGVVPVNAAYFETLGIALKQGRLFSDDERPGAEPVAVVSESAARRLWADGLAVGRPIRVADRFISGSLDTGWRTVVGVVADVRQTFDDADLADVYLPFMQALPDGAWIYATTDRPAGELHAALRAAADSVDSRTLLRIAVPLRQEAARQWATPRFLMFMLTGLAAFAVLLAVVGIYGTTAFAVQQREREIAVRLALGASGTGVTRMFLAESARVVAAGLLIGVAGAVALARLLAHHLHLVDALDLRTFVASAVVVAATALATTWWPARRADGRPITRALNAD